MSLDDYSPLVKQLITLGDPRQQHESENWRDYAALSFTPAHIPDLLRLMLDEDLRSADSDRAEVWAQLHAWRALGQLRAEAAIEPLIDLLPELIDPEDGDDWAQGDFPVVFGLIGPAALPALDRYLSDDSYGIFSRTTASHGLRAIAEQHPASRPECVAAIERVLANFENNDPSFNAFLIGDLLDLKAVESVSLIERAFAAQYVDEGVVGDWEDVQIVLGIKTEREHPPRYNLIPSLPDSLAAPDGGPEEGGFASHPKQIATKSTIRLNEKKEKAKRKAAQKAKKKHRK
jgi:hypothetical protein